MPTSLANGTSQVNLASYGTGNPFSVGDGISIVNSTAGQTAIYGDASLAWTLSNAGTVGGGTGQHSTGGGVGIDLLGAGSYLANTGSIAGGAGGYSDANDANAGRAGGVGVDATGALTVTNSGTILGGHGGGQYEGPSGDGGRGIFIHGAGTVTNLAGGRIVGGDGGYSPYAAGGNGNDGIVIGGFATVVNQAGAVIAGGVGADSNHYAVGKGYEGGGGGLAMVLASGGSIDNAGIIEAGNAAYGPAHPSAAIDFGGTADSTVANSGTIAGGDASSGRGGAIRFSAGDDRLILYAGSLLLGATNGGEGNNVVELAASGSSVGTVNGLGADITRFQLMVVDAGAQWAATGSTKISSGATLAVKGSLAVANATASGIVKVGASGTIAVGNQDTLTLSGAMKVGGAFVSKNGGLAVAGGAATVSAAGKLAVAQLTLSGDGVLTVDGTSSHAGMVNEAAGTTIKVGKGGNFKIARRAQLSGTTTGAGILTLSFAGATIAEGAKLAIARIDLSDGERVTVKTDLTYAGTLSVVAGTKLTVGAARTLSLSGVAGGSGAIDIGSQATLVSRGTLGAAETVTFAARTGVLKIVDLGGFKAGIAGFAAGGRIDIDNAAFRFGKGETLSFVEDAGNSAGTLVLKNGADRVALHLFGQFVAQGFRLSGDDHGGTLVTYHQPAASASDFLASGGHG